MNHAVLGHAQGNTRSSDRICSLESLMNIACCSRVVEYRRFRMERMRAARITTISGMAVALVCACSLCAQAEVGAPPLSGAPAEDPALIHRPAEQPSIDQAIPLIVPSGTPIEVAVDREVHIEKVGQPIRGHVIE